MAHQELDQAVAAAYGWSDYSPEMPDEEILRRLLALNQEQSCRRLSLSRPRYSPLSLHFQSGFGSSTMSWCSGMAQGYRSQTEGLQLILPELLMTFWCARLTGCGQATYTSTAVIRSYLIAKVRTT
jgi:hypothetical protein